MKATKSSGLKHTFVQIALLSTFVHAASLDFQPWPSEDTWVTDGAVNALAAWDGHILAGGSFERVAPSKPFTAIVDAITGEVEALHSRGFIPGMMGSPTGPMVRLVVAGGDGGWYIAGPLQGWIRGDTLFLAGDFSIVGDLQREKLAAGSDGCK